MDSPVLFLAASTAIALISMYVNRRITRATLTAESAFWFVWLFLIWSAEMVSSFPLFEYHYQYPVQPIARGLSVVTFLASAAGFVIGSLVFNEARGASCRFASELRIVSFVRRFQGVVSLAILAIGTTEFTLNSIRYANLLELRLGAVDGELTTATPFTQFFLFAHAFVMIVGFADGVTARISRVAILMSLAGLVLHNLAVGGRINVVVGPALYAIPLLLRAGQREDWARVVKPRVRRFFLGIGLAIVLLFSLLGMLRASTVDFTEVTTIEGFARKFVFAIPMYVSETFIAIPVHAAHALQADVPFGYFTFDGFYRLLEFTQSSQDHRSIGVFGHALYRETPAPWAWTQTNLIPRLIADFGPYFWLAVVPISAFVQWLSLYRIRFGFLGVVIRSLMVFSSAYTILSAAWFTSLNAYVLFYACILYFLAKLDFLKPRRVTSSSASKGVGS